MTPKPDRELLMKACDFIEEGGFDYVQVQILRSWVFNNCQPDVMDVVEIAVHARGVNPTTVDSLSEMVLSGDGKGGSDVMRVAGEIDDLVGLLCRKLLEMTPVNRMTVFLRLEERTPEPVVSEPGGNGTDGVSRGQYDEIRRLAIEGAISDQSAGFWFASAMPALIRGEDGTRVTSAPTPGQSFDLARRLQGYSAEPVIFDEASRATGRVAHIRPEPGMTYYIPQAWRQGSIEWMSEAWLARSSDGLRIDIRPVPNLPEVDLVMRRGRFFSLRKLDCFQISSADLPERLPAILDDMLRRLEAIEAGQDPATVV